MLPINCGSHTDYQNFVVANLRKYYPNPDALAKSTWDIIERFWNLDLSETDTLLASKYSKFGPAPRTPSCMQRSYLLSIDFKVTSLTASPKSPIRFIALVFNQMQSQFLYSLPVPFPVDSNDL